MFLHLIPYFGCNLLKKREHFIPFDPPLNVLNITISSLQAREAVKVQLKWSFYTDGISTKVLNAARFKKGTAVDG